MTAVWTKRLERKAVDNASPRWMRCVTALPSSTSSWPTDIFLASNPLYTIASSGLAPNLLSFSNNSVHNLRTAQYISSSSYCDWHLGLEKSTNLVLSKLVYFGLIESDVRYSVLSSVAHLVNSFSIEFFLSKWDV